MIITCGCGGDRGGRERRCRVVTNEKLTEVKPAFHE